MPIVSFRDTESEATERGGQRAGGNLQPDMACEKRQLPQKLEEEVWLERMCPEVVWVDDVVDFKERKLTSRRCVEGIWPLSPPDH